MEEYGVLSSASIIKYKLQKFGMNFLLFQDSNKRTILHILLDINKAITISSKDYIDLVHDILVKCPFLLCQIDVNGDTPVHILVRNPPNIQFCFGDEHNYFQQLSKKGSDILLKLLELCSHYYTKARASGEGSHCHPPWLIQNIAGNTVLHEAFIKNCHIDIVRKLYELDITIVAALINQKGETPLHILAGTSSSKYEESDNNNDDILQTLVDSYRRAARLADQDGLYPYERAIRVGNILGAFPLINAMERRDVISVDDDNNNNSTLLHMIINQQVHQSINMTKHLSRNTLGLKDSLTIQDKNGMTPLHLAIEHENYDLIEEFFDFIDFEAFTIKNKDGNTPLHLVIQHGLFDFLLRILKLAVDTEDFDVKLLLENENKEGITAGLLIGSRKELPSKLEEYLKKEPKLVGIRSVYGITIPEIKDYVNTMGVIAALLTTLSFTAAFTVPGGLNQDKGTPLLIMKPSFQAFMVFDVLTMCLSTMVLFCLLWIMAANTKRKSVMLMDFCLSMAPGGDEQKIRLETSFHSSRASTRSSWQSNRLVQLCKRLVSTPKKVFDVVIKVCKATHFSCMKIHKSQKKESTPV